MIGHFAAFDLDNYGDLLYMVVFEKMVRIYNESINIERFSFLGGEAPQKVGYTTRPIKELFSSDSDRLSHLVIGGGDVLQVDKTALSSIYGNVYLSHIQSSPRFLLEKVIRKLLNKQPPNLGHWFGERELSYPAVGPFMINPADLSSVKSVVYCSCGAPYEFTQDENIQHTFDNATFIYVRSENTKKKLLDVGVKKEIHAAPDLIITLSDFFDYSTEKEKGRRILKQFNVDVKKKILCLQCMESLRGDDEELIRQLITFQRRTNAEIILLPIGYCHSDDIYLKELCQKSAGLLKYIDVYSAFDILSVIAASNFFLGTSMHGNITAFSFGIPHLFMPTRYDKAEGFLDMVDLSRDFKLTSLRDIDERIEMIENLDKDYFYVRIVEAKRKIYHTFEKMMMSMNLVDSGKFRSKCLTNLLL